MIKNKFILNISSLIEGPKRIFHIPLLLVVFVNISYVEYSFANDCYSKCFDEYTRKFYTSKAAHKACKKCNSFSGNQMSSESSGKEKAGKEKAGKEKAGKKYRGRPLAVHSQ